MTMQDARAGLSAVYRRFSDEELLERWGDGCLTELAVEVAQAELARRGLLAPPYLAKDALATPAVQGPPGELVEVARSQIVGNLQVLGARLDSEGIASWIVNENTNRMGPQFSNAAGGARLLVRAALADDAREIAALLDAGAFALREDEDVG